MKVLAVLLLCAFAAVQGRSAIVSDSRAVATLGENPWITHLRIATSTSGGFLHTCGASLISERWILSAAKCVRDIRYSWVSYGFVNVINPSMVTETAAVRVHPTELVTLIDVYWHVVFTDNIRPVALVSSNRDLPEEAKFCGFGSNEASAHGEVLECFNVSVEKAEDGKLIGSSDSGDFSRFDIGMPLVADGVQIGVLVDITEEQRGVFVATSDLLKWIEDQTGLEISPPATGAPEIPDSSDSSSSSSSSSSSESEEDSRKVKIVN